MPKLSERSRHVRKQIERRARTTAGIYKISQTDINDFLVPLPPTNEQRLVVESVDELASVVDQLETQMESDLARAARLGQSILKRTFEGKLVPQDPNDEPASVLLERIRNSAIDSGTIKGSRKSAGNTRRRAAVTKETEISQ